MVGGNVIQLLPNPARDVFVNQMDKALEQSGVSGNLTRQHC